MGFALIVQIILLIIILYSVLSYLFKRNDNKQNLQQAITNNESTRQLTSEEFELLMSYLDNKSMVKPYQYQSSLMSREVFVITGSCVRQSLSDNGAESSYYFIIGGIEVFIPSGMQSFIENDNVAEVVFTERYAFVVSLNDFSLMDTEEEMDFELNEKWQNGDLGQFKTMTDDDVDNELIQNNRHDIHAMPDAAKKSYCEIIEQRDETLLEQANENKSNTGFLAAVFGIVATILALHYNNSDGLGWLVISGLMFIIASILYFHKPSEPIRKVNRVKGTVTSKDKTYHTLWVGDNLHINYPPHWNSKLPEKTTYDVDMSVIVNSRELVRYDHLLSVDKEIEQYGPRKFWGKNCFLFIVGFILLVYIMLSSSSLTDDVIFSYKWMQNQTVTWGIDDQLSLTSGKIHQGDWVNLNLYGASCDTSLYFKRCKTVYINPTKVDLQNIIQPLPQWAEKLAANSLVIMQRDTQVEMAEDIHNKANGINGYYDKYASNKHKATYTKLLNVNSLILAANEACQSEYTECNELKRLLTKLVSGVGNNKLNDWHAIVNYANKKPPLNAIVGKSFAVQIQRLFLSMSDHLFIAQRTLLLNELVQLQQSNDSIELHLTGGNYAKVYLDEDNQPNCSGNIEQVDYYSKILSRGVGHVKMNGLVSDITYRDDGTIKRLNINDNNRYYLDDNVLIPSAVITALTFVMVTLVTLLQGINWVRKVHFNKRRLNRMLSDYNQHVL